ncbi:hypothetical protein PHPALM_30862 [Phytophthora palmivora]|uniref:Uncharacterized protein n=1 Tax=Phytophthora palmivora TaxID=4796 RepID=A0A2P4X414_9STRA|nr:hypothetical protein PHPALM_30862 [Phytophthora palmivora]
MLINLLTFYRCTSYAKYQQFKCDNYTFTAFCRDTATCLSDLIDENANEDPDQGGTASITLASDELEGFVTIPPPQTFSYRKRDHFNSDSEWVKRRLSISELHLPKTCRTLAKDIRHDTNALCVELLYAAIHAGRTMNLVLTGLMRLANSLSCVPKSWSNRDELDPLHSLANGTCHLWSQMSDALPG